MKMGRSVLAYLPVNLANVLVSFGTIVVLTRLLGPEEFGRYAIAMISMQFAHLALFTWLEAAMARYQAKAEKDGDVPSHLRTLYATGLAMSFTGILLLVAFIALAPLPDDLKTVIAFAVGSTCIQIFYNLGMEAHRAAHRIWRYSAIHSSQTALSFAIGIALVMLTPLREVGPYIGIIAGLLVTLCLDLPFMLGQQSGGRVERPRIRRYAVYGLPICLSVMLGYALNSADVYIIAAIMGEASAGQYNAGYNLSNRSLEILFVWLSMAVTPVAITALEKQGIDQSVDVMRDYGASLLLLAMPAAVGIALVAQDAGFILGESVRAEAVTVMPAIALAGLLNGLITYYVHRAFMFSGRTADFIWIMVPPVILNLALNILWVPTYGLMGAVAATLAGYGLAFIMAVLLARRHYPLPLPYQAFAQIALACGVMSAVVLSLPVGDIEPGPATLLAKSVIGGVAYILTCWAPNAADCRTVLRKLLSRNRIPEWLEPAE